MILHRAQLQQVEDAEVPAHPSLTKQHRTFRIHLDEDSAHQQNWQREKEKANSKQTINAALQHERSRATANRSLHRQLNLSEDRKQKARRQGLSEWQAAM
jgi:hypothetical protein